MGELDKMREARNEYLALLADRDAKIDQMITQLQTSATKASQNS